jgi:hypothetical protein
MAKIRDLEKYLDYTFSTGNYTGKDYLSFQTKYINYLKGLCNDNGWEFVKACKTHYEFSAFIKNSDNKFIYLSISDVRFFFNEWYTHILVRRAEHEKDYTGGRNNYTTLPNLVSTLNWLFELNNRCA